MSSGAPGAVPKALKSSPPLTIKRLGRTNGQWQEFIDREQSSVDQLIQDSFAVYCKENSRNRSGSFGESSGTLKAVPSGMRQQMYSTGSLTRTPMKYRPSEGASSSSSGLLSNTTMPRRSPGKRALFQTPSETESRLRDLVRRSGDLKLRVDEDEPVRNARRNRRSESSDRSSSSNGLPPGIEELETLYAPMRNLMQPLPNAKRYSGHAMPSLHPLGSTASPWQTRQSTTVPTLSEIHRMREARSQSRDDDQESEICSVIIPPPPKPVQSHAILQESLGKEIPPIPRTPMRSQKFPDWGKTPPLPPKRTSSKLSLLPSRPKHLSLSDSSSNASSTIYANTKTQLHRSSLMSTGSSENSSDSSLPSFEPPVTPVTPNSERELFSWPNYSIGWSTSANEATSTPSPSPSDEHRSVSQIGEPPDSASDCSSSVNTSLNSGVYVKMNPMFPVEDKDSHYMNVLYNAVQRQGGAGSVENAISPYIAMGGKINNNVKLLPNASVDGVSAIYATPHAVTPKKKSASTTTPPSSSGSVKARVRSHSTSRLQEVKSRAKKKLSTSSKAKALAEFKELMQEVEKKRHFRVGLNIFNSKPQQGIDYLVQKDYLELSPSSVARFLHKNPGLSKDKVGEYLGDLQNPFAMKVLSCFMQELDFSGLRVDKALRKLLQYVRVPGEAQKIEKIMEVFGKRYNKCNPSFASKLKSPDSVVTLSFATMLLNTDLHTPNLKEERKMSCSDFVNNLRGVDGGKDFEGKLLKSIYKGIKKQEFVGGADHVLQTQVIQQSIVHEKKPAPQLAEPHRRLVCLCRLYEVLDLNSRKESSEGEHPRDIFLFNDLLVVTKQQAGSGGKGRSSQYAFRDAFSLQGGLEVTLFHTPVFKHGVQIGRKRDGKVLVTLNARSEHDRYKFVMDLQESIFEMDWMAQVMRETPS